MQLLIHILDFHIIFNFVSKEIAFWACFELAEMFSSLAIFYISGVFWKIRGKVNTKIWVLPVTGQKQTGWQVDARFFLEHSVCQRDLGADIFL